MHPQPSHLSEVHNSARHAADDLLEVFLGAWQLKISMENWGDFLADLFWGKFWEAEKKMLVQKKKVTYSWMSWCANKKTQFSVDL